MKLVGDRRAQQGKGAAEGSGIGSSLGIEVGEAAVDQVAAQLPFQIAEAPTLEVLHDTAAQQTIGGDSGSPGALGKRAACGQTLADQVHQSGILEELIDGIEQVVFEQSRLLGQGEVE